MAQARDQDHQQTKTIKSTIEGLIKPDTEATKLRCRGPRERERELSHRHHLDPKPYTAGAGAGYTPARSLSQAPGARGAPGQAAAAGLNSRRGLRREASRRARPDQQASARASTVQCIRPAAASWRPAIPPGPGAKPSASATAFSPGSTRACPPHPPLRPPLPPPPRPPGRPPPACA